MHEIANLNDKKGEVDMLPEKRPLLPFESYFLKSTAEVMPDLFTTYPHRRGAPPPAAAAEARTERRRSSALLPPADMVRRT